MPSATPTPTASPIPEGKQGDADCDTQITTFDSLSILLYAGNLNGGSACPALANANCNGSVDATDALLVLKYLLGQTASIPNCPQVGASF